MLADSICAFRYRKLDGEIRNILCTCDWDFLNSFEGATQFKFVPPTQSPVYDVDATENIIVWDIEKMAWRTIKASNVLEHLWSRKTRS